jgi:hypothetical protein
LALRELIDETSLDVLCLTETWLTPSSNATIAALVPDTHCFYHVPRSNALGGGVGVVLSKNLRSIKMISHAEFLSMECIELTFSCFSRKFRLINIYRPPSKSRRLFIEEFDDLINSVILEDSHLIICGDFNFWVDDRTSVDSQRFLDCLHSLNLINHVTIPTVDSGHFLDLVISSSVRRLVYDLQVEPDCFYSDHKLITFSVEVPMKIKVKKKNSFRNLKNLNIDSFIDAIKNVYAGTVPLGCLCNQLTEDDLEWCTVCLTSGYNNSVSIVFEKMCPFISKEIVDCDFCPWYNTDIRMAKKKRRKAESLWRRTRTWADRIKYTLERNNVNSLLIAARKEYFCEKISACGNDYKKLYFFLNRLLGKSKDVSLPEHDSSIDLANDFAKYFVSKIDTINSKLRNCLHQDISYLPDLPYSELSQFAHVPLMEIKTLIGKVKRTYCLGDPVDYSRVKSEAFDVFLCGMFFKIVNASFDSAIFPDSQKIAFVHPLLKKGLDMNDMKSYRPISHLTFLSKVLESAVLNQLTTHLEKIGALPRFQSAYRSFHSTETALCRVYNDLVLNMDSGRCTLLLLLDLSAAFDTVDHALLLADLFCLGVTGNALEWFRSYLANRNFCVVIEDECSEKRALTTGVPQGSILGPILFMIYMIGLSYLLDEFGIGYHFYADDTQLYVVVDDVDSTNVLLERILESVTNWMIQKRLKLNGNKTECMLIGTRSSVAKFPVLPNVRVIDSTVDLSNKLKDLGFILDQELSLTSQINSTVKVANYALANISYIRKFIDLKTTVKLIHNLVLSKIDYCNSLYYGLPNYDLHRLQLIVNKAARLALFVPRWQHITPALIELHFLPVKARIIFKICLLTFKALHFGEPYYLRSLLSFYETGTSMSLRRGDDKNRLLEHRVLRRFGERCFWYCAPRLYNKLPTVIRSSTTIANFKKKLKTYLFTESFDLVSATINDEFKV